MTAQPLWRGKTVSRWEPRVGHPDDAILSHTLCHVDVPTGTEVVVLTEEAWTAQLAGLIEQVASAHDEIKRLRAGVSAPPADVVDDVTGDVESAISIAAGLDMGDDGNRDWVHDLAAEVMRLVRPLAIVSAPQVTRTENVLWAGRVTALDPIDLPFGTPVVVRRATASDMESW
jgi:hypothetical protein